ncbi:MAG: hypothetical protein Q9210_006099 [Variospora velana]
MESIEAGNLFSVTNLVAVVTGGGTGIGLMMAKALAANGASKVYIIGRRKEVLEEAAKESSHGNIIPLVGDITSNESLQSIVSQIEKDAGFINLLVANSGIGGPQTSPLNPTSSLKDYQSALWNLAPQEYSEDIRRQQQKSQFIVTSSIAGFNRNTPGGHAYGQSKAAATHLAKQMATQLVPYGIRSNAIAPGLYPSEMAAPIIGTGVTTKDKIPAERVGSNEDMAGCILYMASRAGAYLNGSVIVTDGGRLSIMPSAF